MRLELGEALAAAAGHEVVWGRGAALGEVIDLELAIDRSAPPPWCAAQG